MKEIKIAYYNQQCTRSGERCYDEDMIERESDDLIIFHLTEANIQKEKKYAQGMAYKPIALNSNAVFENRIYSNLLQEIAVFEATL